MLFFLSEKVFFSSTSTPLTPLWFAPDTVVKHARNSFFSCARVSLFLRVLRIFLSSNKCSTFPRFTYTDAKGGKFTKFTALTASDEFMQ